MMKFYRCHYLLILLFCFAHWAVAQEKAGFMVNISASGAVDPRRGLVQVACAMIEDTVPLAIFAEAVTPDTNPGLLLLRVGASVPQKIAENNDYTSLPPADLRVLSKRLRLPNRITDAALLGTTSDAALCAVGFEVREDGPPGRINISINDLVRVATSATDKAAAAGAAAVVAETAVSDPLIDEALKTRVLEAALQRINRR